MVVSTSVEIEGAGAVVTRFPDESVTENSAKIGLGETVVLRVTLSCIVFVVDPPLEEEEQRTIRGMSRHRIT